MIDKPAVVMIHGLLGSLDFFSPSSRLFDLEVYTPRLVGYGGAEDGKKIENLALKDQVDFVKRLVADEIGKPFWLLGHSVGGAIAMMFAAQNPKLVAGIINVEGNFTLNDAFWCQKISPLPSEVWHRDYEQMRAEPEKWLLDSGINPTPERASWAAEILDFQTTATVQAVAKAVVRETPSPEYENTILKVVEQKTPVYLLAGERSKDGWDVPQRVIDAAEKFVVQPQTGHLMMLEEPDEFCAIVKGIIASARL